MFYKVKSVTALPGYVLHVSFENGAERKYDMQPLFEQYPIFRDLQNIPGLFHQVKVDVGGYGISWNDDTDLSCNELWTNSTPIQS